MRACCKAPAYERKRMRDGVCRNRWPFHPQPLFVPFQPFGVDVYKIKRSQRTAEFRQRGAEFLKGLGVAYTFLDQQTVDVVVQI